MNCPFCRKELTSSSFGPPGSYFFTCEAQCNDPSYSACVADKAEDSYFFLHKDLKNVRWFILYSSLKKEYYVSIYRSTKIFNLLHSPMETVLTCPALDDSPHTALQFLNRVINSKSFL